MKKAGAVNAGLFIREYLFFGMMKNKPAFLNKC